MHKNQPEQPDGTPPLRFLRAKEVCERLGIKKTKLYALLSEAGSYFPVPAKIGAVSVWDEREIEEFMEERLAARDLWRSDS